MASRYSFIETVQNPALNNLDMKGFASIDFIKSFLDGKENIKNIPNGFQYRPDKLAEYYYGNSTYYWILIFVNNLENGIEDFIEGRQIIVPSLKTIRNILGD